MTEPVRGATHEDDIMRYLITGLDNLDIAIGYTTGSAEKLTDVTMDEDELLSFRPEEVPLVWPLGPNEDGYYGLELNILEGIGLFYSPDDFVKMDEASLLHLFSIARREFLCNGVDLSGARTIELTRNEDENIVTTHMPLAYLERILDAAILRRSFVYMNYTPQKRMDKFYRDEVYPLLNLEALDEEDE